MNPIIPFETALQFLAMAYLTSVILLMLTSYICLAVIEIIENTVGSGS